MKLRTIPRVFYERDARTVARALLGKLLVRRSANGSIRAGRIVETEAYLENDPAAHFYRGMTPRTAVVYGPAGHAYVYFTYGMHYCTNVNCKVGARVGAVLLRALEPVQGIPAMARARGLKLGADRDPLALRSLTSGPARLSQALSITSKHGNGLDLTKKKGPLCVVEDGFHAGKIGITTRIGISKAREKKWRYTLAGNIFVSK